MKRTPGARRRRLDLREPEDMFPSLHPGERQEVVDEVTEPGVFPRDELQVPGPGVVPAHPLQHPVRPGLQRQVEVRHELGHLGEAPDQVFGQVEAPKCSP